LQVNHFVSGLEPLIIILKFLRSLNLSKNHLHRLKVNLRLLMLSFLKRKLLLKRFKMKLPLLMQTLKEVRISWSN